MRTRHLKTKRKKRGRPYVLAECFVAVSRSLCASILEKHFDAALVFQCAYTNLRQVHHRLPAVGVETASGAIQRVQIVSSAYIQRLKLSVEQLHRCTAIHVASSPVHEVFNGKTVWKGDVEVFKIEKHPRAKKCYAWAVREGPDAQAERFVVVLEIPPVVSPQTAVRSQIVRDDKDSYSD